MSEEIKLNLGAGGHPMDGFVNIDAGYSADCDAGCYAGEVYPLAEWSDGTVDEVRASHVLEHFPHRDTYAVLTEWVRVLRPGGWLKIAVPDVMWICKAIIDPNTSPQQAYLAHLYLMGGQTDARDFHKAIFDETGLRVAFGMLGLVDAQRWESEIEDCARLPVSLNLMGRKPEAGETLSHRQSFEAPGVDAGERFAAPDVSPVSIPVGSVLGVISAPRFGYVDFWVDVHNALRPLGIELAVHRGVFWAQCIERGLESAVNEGAKYILTLDHDTVFQPDDVRSLYALMESRAEIGAVCAVQMRREVGVVLAGMHDDGSGSAVSFVPMDRFSGPTARIDTGHFGLTLIRASSLASVPKPWFHDVPDESGEWGEGRCDADVAFWHKFGAAGNELHLANRVTVGHMEDVITWPSRRLQPIVQPVTDYRIHGKPTGEGTDIWR